MTNFEKVREWMAIAGQNVRYEPVASIPEKQLRIDLIKEEFHEFESGAMHNDLEEIADGIADLLYVVYGAAVSYGIDADKIFDVVHENNLTKFIDCPACDGSGIRYTDMGEQDSCLVCDGHGKVPYDRRPDGKILKNPTWKPPDLKPLLGLA